MASMSPTTLDTSEACERVVRAFNRIEQVTAFGQRPDGFICSTKFHAPRVSPNCTRAFKMPWYVTKLAGMLLSDISLRSSRAAFILPSARCPFITVL